MAATEGICFFDLPAEIRNEIYRLTFERITTAISRDENRETRHHVVTHSTSSDNCIKGLPGILHTNRQVRAECSLLFYSTTCFVALSSRALVSWLSVLEREQRSSIKHLCRREEIPRAGNTAMVKYLLRLIKTDVARRLKESALAFSHRVVKYEIWEEGNPWGLARKKVWPRK